MTSPADRPNSPEPSSDRVEKLLASCLETETAHTEARLDELCAANRDVAQDLRERFAMLREAGLLELEPTQWDPARVFGPYEIVREIGRGGMGIVYLAEQPAMHRRVALKLIPNAASRPRVLARFRREIEAASSLDHPGICAIYDAGQIEDTLYIAMPFIEGETLSARVHRMREANAVAPASTQRDTNEVVALCVRVARALHHAHEHGSIHRDVKPANIMVTPEGDAVLIDFGLARPDESGDTFTLTGDTVGTPAFMAPEQISGDGRSIDRRTDVYALGVTLFESLTLELPFRAATREALYHEILTAGSVDTHEQVRPLSRDLRVVLSTAMEREPNARYQTAEEFADDLDRVLRGVPIHARPQPWAARMMRRARSKPGLTVAFALALIAIPTATILAGKWSAMQPALEVGRAAMRMAKCERELAEGFSRYYSGAIEAARSSFVRANEHVPGELEAVAGMVLCDLRRRDFVRADRLVAGLDRGIPMVQRLRAMLARTSIDERPWEEVPVQEDTADLFLQGSLCLMEAYNSACNDALRTSFFRRASGFLRRAVLLAPRPRLHHYRQLTHAVAMLDDKSSAIDLTAVLRRRWPDEPSALLVGALALREHDASTAEQICWEVHERWPEYPGVDILAELLQRRGDVDRARSVLRAFVESGHAMPSSYRSLAMLEGGGSGGPVIELAREAVRRFPQMADTHVFLGATLARTADLPAARKSIETALKIEPKHLRARAESLAIRFLETRSDRAKLEVVERDARVFVDAAPKSVVVLQVLGKICAARREFEPAETWYRKAIDAEEGADIWVNLGNVLLERGADEEALRAFERAVVVGPRNARAHYSLGTLLQKRKNFAGARTALREAIRLRDDYAQAYCNLAIVLANNGAAGEAVALIEKGHALGEARADWSYPSARWREQITAMAERERQRLEILDHGSRPESADDLRGVLSLAIHRERYVDGVRVLDAALASSTPLPDSVGSASHNAGTVCLLHAGMGFGHGAHGDAERLAFRRRALTRLRSDLQTWHRVVTRDSGKWQGVAAKQLRLILRDPTMSRVRDPRAFESLPAEERAAFVAIWSDIRAAETKFSGR
jgi:tetratricopeptide (TPR) repeat protein